MGYLRSRRPRSPTVPFAVGCPTPAWLADHRPVSATGQFDVAAPTDNPQAVIKVEQIAGPVLLVCGQADLVWESCRYADAIVQRRRNHHPTRSSTLLSYPSAGHGLILLAPFVPRAVPPPQARMYGATPLANDEALADAWPKILHAIRST